MCQITTVDISSSFKMNELISRKNCIIPSCLQVAGCSGLGIDLRHRGYAGKQDKHQCCMVRLWAEPLLSRFLFNSSAIIEALK